MVLKYLLAACAGAAAGYYVAQKRMSQNYRDLLAAETEEAKEYYRSKYDQMYEELLLKNQYEEEIAVYRVGPSILQQEETHAQEISDPFVDSEEDSTESNEIEDDSVVSEKVEIKVRGLGKVTPPEKVDYHKLSAPVKDENPESVAEETQPVIQIDILDKSAFMEDQFNYPQYSLTYYAEDNVLSGQSDQIIPTQSRREYLGEDFLLQVRDGAQDTVWIRNHAKKIELEIERSPGKYSEEVQPLEDARTPRSDESLEDIMG